MRMKTRMLIGSLAIIMITLIFRCFFIVDETQWGLVLRFGQPRRLVSEAGLHFKIPFNNLRYFDKRLQLYNPPASEFLTQDKKNLVIDNYVCWKVADPLKLLQSVGDFIGAEMRLHDIVWAELSAALGSYELAQLISTNSEQVKLEELMGKVVKGCQKVAFEQYGIEVVDVRIKRLSFPQQNKEAVFARMRAERERIAKSYKAEGAEEAMRIKAEADRQKEHILAEAYQQAEKVKGEGDAEAARIYGQAYGKDPEFYKFLRTLEAYKKAIDDKTTVVLSSDSEFLRLLIRGRNR